ncbi:MAG: hypothetical protein QOH04_1494 [Sphingomonadales bacterium]|jgi:hypothetical protein|nr:hypothetical protein [Sphingomonadales bacterium]MEA3035729.1 hypothetical protein [Sphingomonadales bacterium]
MRLGMPSPSHRFAAGPSLSLGGRGVGARRFPLSLEGRGTGAKRQGEGT